MLPSKNILYLGLDKNNNSYIGVYSSAKKEDKVLRKADINTDCRPSVSQSGSTLFVTKSEDENLINIMDAEGNIKEILKGDYPVWLEDDKKFIYYCDRDIRIYDLLTNKSQKIKKSISIKATPVISPDKKYMAIFELDTVAFFGGETVDYLRIIPIADDGKAEVSAFHKTRRTDSWGGLEWIE
jgi:Tol biopolymer transport system component